MIYKHKTILKMLKLLFFIWSRMSTPIVWDRIVQFQVNERVSDFLNNRGLNNCYEYEENQDNLHLKCWVYNELVNVDISMYKNEEPRYI